jgi:hypothetical protein
MFRSGDFESTLNQLKKIDITEKDPLSPYRLHRTSIKSKDDLDYAFKLQNKLSSLTDIDVRVESPWISIYTNTKTNVDDLIKLDQDKVKYISVPPANTTLDVGVIIMPKTDFDYRVTLGKTTEEHSTFVNWAEASTKIKLTKSCKKDLLKNRTWGGTHFYITGEKNLLMAKMHLGGSISKIERIVKAINT